MSPILGPEEVAKWTLDADAEDGVALDIDVALAQDAHEDQAVMGQNGPVLEGGAGCCLLIPVYVPEHKLGLLIHLDWQDALNEGEELIRAPFLRYPALRDRPVVRVIFSEALHGRHPGQIDEAKQFLRQLLPDAELGDLIVGFEGDQEDDELMGVTARLDTRTGLLEIDDDFGEHEPYDLSVRSA